MIHSWWIPKLGGKADAVPGHTNETWFKISKPGVYKGQCAELCGRGPRRHARPRARGSPEEYTELRGATQGRDQAAQEGLAEQRSQREAEEQEVE